MVVDSAALTADWMVGCLVEEWVAQMDAWMAGRLADRTAAPLDARMVDSMADQKAGHSVVSKAVMLDEHWVETWVAQMAAQMAENLDAKSAVY